MRLYLCPFTVWREEALGRGFIFARTSSFLAERVRVRIICLLCFPLLFDLFLLGTFARTHLFGVVDRRRV